MATTVKIEIAENKSTQQATQLHSESEITLIWFQLRWKRQQQNQEHDDQQSTTSDNCWARPQQIHELVAENPWFSMEHVARIAFGLSICCLWACWLNAKLRVSAHGRRTCATPTQLQHSHHGIWIIEFEFEFEFRQMSRPTPAWQKPV